MTRSDLPETEDGLHDDCRITERNQLVATLREIARHRALVTLHYAGPGGYYVTSLLAIDAAAGALTIDAAQDPGVNRAVAASRHLVAVTRVDRIKHQFAAAAAAPVVHEGAAAFRLRLPDSLVRLQRRKAYRLPVPSSAPLSCQVPLAGGAALRLRVRDLSVDGVCLLSGERHPAFEPGQVFHDCRIDLPGHGVVITAMELRNVMADGDGAARAYGCRFLNLAGTVGNLIQRYAIDAQRARRRDA
ncbi:MAG: flagellar brake protein [Burkholderiales bacterium]|nr:flagellar brake protein [Burkholderiales bacterium]